MTPFRDDWITYEERPTDFVLNVGPFKTGNNGMQHAINQFRYLYELTDRPMAIALSGGIDSQSITLAAKASGVPFKIYSLRFSKELNLHDLSTGIELAESHNLSINFVDIDITKFYTSGKYLEYIDPYKNSSPQVAALLWFYEKIADNNVIIGPGNPIIKHSGGYSGMNNFTLFAWERFCQVKNIPMVGFFLWYTAELFGSLYREVEEDFTAIEPYSLKCGVYRENGFDVIPQTHKQNGFENVKEEFFRLYPRTRTPYDTFYRYPHEERNNKQIVVNWHNQ